ncbi:MAG: ABC transporter ATP-binding protein [Nitrospira sp.]|nr:ATP-binding cassette domain-containing protein [Nitrospira sp.]
MGDPCILSVDGIGKKFCATQPHSMYYGVHDVCRNILGMAADTHRLRPHEFWAVDGVTFTLKQGERLGLLGGNGSGKSTLLRLLAGIYQPDKGRIEVRGRVGALIALGAGFHPLLTGRENIFLNGSLLGMTTCEIEQCFDQIVDFADIGTFLDAPVKTYSSGMYVRLGFAIVIHSRPDLLLIDEVLAVGDSSFQNKCIEKVLELNRNGTAIIFVSHAIQTIERLCRSGLLLRQGAQVFQGEIRDCIQRYSNQLARENLLDAPQPTSFGLGTVDISNVDVFEEGGTSENRSIPFGKNFVIRFDYDFLQDSSHNRQVRVWIRTQDGRDVQRLTFQEAPFNGTHQYGNVKVHRMQHSGTVQITVLNPRLFPQSFLIDIAIVPMDRNVHLGGLANATLFNVVPPPADDRYFEYGNMTVTDFDYVVAVD